MVMSVTSRMTNCPGLPGTDGCPRHRTSRADCGKVTGSGPDNLGLNPTSTIF